MTRDPRSSDWPHLPAAPIDDEARNFVERARTMALDFHDRRLLSAAFINIHDQNGDPWRAPLTVTDQSTRTQPFAPLNDVDFSYRRCLSLRFATDFPLQLFQNVYATFPDAEYHLPPLIVRGDRCHSPLIDEEPELGIIVR